MKTKEEIKTAWREAQKLTNTSVTDIHDSVFDAPQMAEPQQMDAPRRRGRPQKQQMTPGPEPIQDFRQRLANTQTAVQHAMQAGETTFGQLKQAAALYESNGDFHALYRLLFSIQKKCQDTMMEFYQSAQYIGHCANIMGQEAGVIRKPGTFDEENRPASQTPGSSAPVGGPVAQPTSMESQTRPKPAPVAQDPFSVTTPYDNI